MDLISEEMKMNLEFHTLNALFAQLGLPNDEESIKQFINKHSLEKNIRIDQASFWTSNNSMFLREAIEEDSDWTGIVDQLDRQLRS